MEFNPAHEPREVRSNSKPRRFPRWLQLLAVAMMIAIVSAVLVVTLPNINFYPTF